MTAEDTVPIGRKESRSGGQSATAVCSIPALLAVLLVLLRGFMAPRKLIASALTAGLLLAPLPAAFAHDGLDLAVQASSTAPDGPEHGHSHVDDRDGDSPAGHAHNGHDAADHSHQFAFLAVSVGHGVLSLPQCWPSLWNGAPDQAAGFGIDRPPKRMMSP